MEPTQAETSEQTRPANVLEAWHASLRSAVEKMLRSLNETIEAGQVMELIAPVDVVQSASPLGEALSRQPAGSDGYYALHIGCGISSRIGRKLADKPVRVIGADPIATAIQQALHNARMRQPHPIINVAAEELALVWPPESFHLVYTDALTRMASPRRAVEQMVRLLRPGASALVALHETSSGLWRWEQADNGGAVTCRNDYGDVQLLPAHYRSATIGTSGLLLHFYRPASGLVLPT